MGLFDKFKTGLQKTHHRLVHEIRRIVTRSPRLTGESLDELEAVLLGADLGVAMTDQIIRQVKRAYESQGQSALDIFSIAQQEVEEAATRLNYDIAGFRTLMFATGRALPAETTDSARDALTAIDPRWGERETWAALARAGRVVSDVYLLAALDLRRGADDAITGAPQEQAVFRNVLGRTLWISAMVTVACLALGYPVAFFIARQPPLRASILLFLVLLPFWTSLLLRTVAWVVLLQREGILNNLLLSLGLITEPVRMIFNRFAVYVAMVHVLLPFMVLPLYAVMRAMGLHAGIDVARGPEENAFYLIVGSAWR